MRSRLSRGAISIMTVGDRLVQISHQYSALNIMSLTVGLEDKHVEYWRHLEIWVRGRSKSLEMAPFDRSHFRLPSWPCLIPFSK